MVGKVTSSTWSPYQVCGVGIVHMKNNDLGPGAILDVKCTDGNIRKGELCKLPMYDAKGEIVRGVNTDIPSQPKPWEGLSSLDKVAYVRFASVYKNFKEAKDFEEFVGKLDETKS